MLDLNTNCGFQTNCQSVTLSQLELDSTLITIPTFLKRPVYALRIKITFDVIVNTTRYSQFVGTI